MTLARKGSRRIVVGGTTYRWTVSPDDEPGLGIVVEHGGRAGQRMVTWVDHGNVISPAVVRLAILHALDQGWTPGVPGKELRFRLGGLQLRGA